MENEEEKDNSETSEEETVTENTELTVEDYNQLKAEKESLEAKNKQLYARLKTTPKPLQNNLQTNSTSDNPDLQARFEKLELKSEGYNDLESEFILQYGGKKALDNPIVKTALEVMREKSRAEQAVVDTTNSGGDIEKKFTNEQLKTMPLEELEKLLK